jgi:hypothetical protein
MKRFMLILSSVIILTISACSSTPSDSDIQTAIAKTSLAQPTETRTSTNIPTATNTLSPSATFTLTKTSTLTATLTPTVTDTATPIPPATLTQQAFNESYTATAKSRTKTAESQNATATEIASYEEIYWKDLATYPNNYIGQKVVVRGRVFNILTNVIQIYFAGTYEALYVSLSEPASGIYEDNAITVYGVVSGKECFENAYGAEICQPALEDAWFTKP